ncbi:MAG TPA: hypothetical protein VN048_13735 [Verrucomicrobiae bacterium]|jgi:hypothetical protein|nr:hypothetical protein [Verrucomicrobiae bacterium]
MFARITFFASAVFWVTMNYLLWRSEYGGPNNKGGQVPAEVVWRKIITSPDNSSLDILHHGKKAGYARWAVNERRDPASAGNLVGDLPVNGPADAPKGYLLDLQGNVAPDSNTGRIYFDLSLELATNRAWEQVAIRISIGKSSLAVRSRAAEQNVHLLTDEEGEKQERVLTFAELKSPQALAAAFAVPLPPELVGISEMSTNALEDILPAESMEWQARSDWINIGHTAARAYRLQTRLLDRWQFVIMVSPVGEILRVELPDDWVLVSDQTAGF